MEMQDRRQAVAEEIRAELARQNMSLASLSTKTGLSTKILRARLKGKKPFFVDEIELVAIALNMHTLDLLARSYK